MAVATATHSQTRHKPLQSRIMARQGAFALVAVATSARTVPAQNSTAAQFPHNRTFTHNFFCRLLPKDAK